NCCSDVNIARSSKGRMDFSLGSCPQRPSLRGRRAVWRKFSIASLPCNASTLLTTRFAFELSSRGPSWTRLLTPRALLIERAREFWSAFSACEDNPTDSARTPRNLSRNRESARVVAHRRNPFAGNATKRKTPRVELSASRVNRCGAQFLGRNGELP